MINRKEVSKLCDVYSYGTFLWELVTQQLPYSDVSPPWMVMKKVSEGEVGGLKFILNFCLHRILAIQWASGLRGNDGNRKRKQKHGKYRACMPLGTDLTCVLP